MTAIKESGRSWGFYNDKSLLIQVDLVNLALSIPDSGIKSDRTCGWLTTTRSKSCLFRGGVVYHPSDWLDEVTFDVKAVQCRRRTCHRRRYHDSG